MVSESGLISENSNSTEKQEQACIDHDIVDEISHKSFQI